MHLVWPTAGGSVGYNPVYAQTTASLRRRKDPLEQIKRRDPLEQNKSRRDQLDKKTRRDPTEQKKKVVGGIVHPRGRDEYAREATL